MSRAPANRPRREAPAPNMSQRIRKWSNDRLDRELIFARAAIRWLDCLEREAHRRYPEGLPYSTRRSA